MCLKKFDAEFFFYQTYRVFNLVRGLSSKSYLLPSCIRFAMSRLISYRMWEQIFPLIITFLAVVAKVKELPHRGHLICSTVLISECRVQLLLHTIFCLSSCYKPVDISLAVGCGLLPVLFSMDGCFSVGPYIVQRRKGRLLPVDLHKIQRSASYRLIQLISVTTG